MNALASAPAQASVTAPAVAHYRDAFERVRPALPGSHACRSAAMARFAELGFPSPRDEAWKYTSLRRLESRRFEPATPGSAAVGEISAALVTQRLVLVNGVPAGTLPAAMAGFRLGTLATVTDDLLLRAISHGGTERFAALNAAFSASPLLLEMDCAAAGQRGAAAHADDGRSGPDARQSANRRAHGAGQPRPPAARARG